MEVWAAYLTKEYIKKNIVYTKGSFRIRFIERFVSLVGENK